MSGRDAPPARARPGWAWEEHVLRTRARRNRLGWGVGWLAVFAANLPVPLLFGWGMADGDGQLGVVAALAALGFAGLLAVLRVPGAGAVLVPGSVVVAAFQVYPLPHIAAGALALGWGESLGVASGHAVEGFTGGFVVTLATGLQLFAAAAVTGSMMFGLVLALKATEARGPGVQDGPK